MLAKEFFRCISSGTRTGVVRFRNGLEAFIDTKTLRTNMAGDVYTIKVPLGFKEEIELSYDDFWTLVPNLEPGKPSEWDVMSAYFDDMAWKVEQVACGKIKGFFYTTAGDRYIANQETLKLEPYYPTTRKFTIKGHGGVPMYYTVPLCSDICNHGQLASLNFIDFIEDV